MMELCEPGPALVVLSVLSRDVDGHLTSLAPELCARLGPLAWRGGLHPFDHTAYYEPEMGGPLFRRLVAFETLVPQDALPGIKRFVHALEKDCAIRLGQPGRRPVNLDPGLLTLERFVLASSKPFAHRVYLGQGVWANLELIYRLTKPGKPGKGGDFTPLPWSFPDYAGELLRAELRTLREELRKRLASSGRLIPRDA